MRLLFVRHGETTWNRDGRYQGQSDPPLSARGEEQARAIADRLAAEDVATIVTSPLIRARATAQLVATRLDLPLATDSRLTEITYGEWEGLHQAEVKLRWPAALRSWKRTPERVTFPGGESLYELQARVRSFLAHMSRQSGTIVAVTHSGFVKLAALEIQGLPLAAFRNVYVGNASITACTMRGDEFVICSLNDVAHLPDGK